MSTSASTPEPSSNWLPPDNNDDQSSLQWFAYDSTTDPLLSSGGPCDPKVALKISQVKFDFGKFVPPNLGNLPDIEKINKRLGEILNRVTAIKEDFGDNPSPEIISELQALVNESNALIKKFRALKVNIVPFVPLVPPQPITLTLTSDPSELPGNIGPIQEWAIRPRADATEIRSTGRWVPIGSNSGNTTLISKWELNGNYGFTDFIGYVSCCDHDWKTTRVNLEVTGMCRGDAQAALDAAILKARRALSQTANLVAALAGFFAALAIALAAASVGHPGLLIGAGLSLLLALIAASVAYDLTEEAWRMGDDFEKRSRALADPYIKELPPCTP